MNEAALLSVPVISLAIALALGLALFLTGPHRDRRSIPPAQRPAAPSRVLDVTRPSHWLPTVLAILAVASSGCIVTPRTACCRSSCEMPTRWIEPPREYGEPMHPILRENGQTILMPHTKFRGWIREESASETRPPG